MPHMKHVFFAGLALCSATLISLPAIADEDASTAEERVIHYAIEEPKTTEAAVKLLQEKTKEIGAILANDTLDSNHMEAIHEKTYSLEAAVDKLRAEDNSQMHENALDAADEAVQALHYASENHEQTQSRKWYGSLEPAVEMVKSAYTPHMAKAPAAGN